MTPQDPRELVKEARRGYYGATASNIITRLIAALDMSFDQSDKLAHDHSSICLENSRLKLALDLAKRQRDSYINRSHSDLDWDTRNDDIDAILNGEL